MLCRVKVMAVGCSTMQQPHQQERQSFALPPTAPQPPPPSRHPLVLLDGLFVFEGAVEALFVCVQVRLRSAVEDFIDEGAAPAERMIRDLVECEHAYINTDHPQFIGGNRALSQVKQGRHSR